MVWPNFTYDFQQLRGCHLSDNTRGFILPLILLEASFHLPFHPFFYSMLNEYSIAPGQLFALSWWTLVPFFIDCCIHNEPPMLGVFQKIYHLKVKGQVALIGNAHFSIRQGFGPIIKIGLRTFISKKDKFVRVICNLKIDFVLSIL